MGDEFKIECHECGELTYVQAESLPEYCPMSEGELKPKA